MHRLSTTRQTVSWSQRCTRQSFNVKSVGTLLQNRAALAFRELKILVYTCEWNLKTHKGKSKFVAGHKTMIHVLNMLQQLSRVKEGCRSMCKLLKRWKLDKSNFAVGLERSQDRQREKRSKSSKCDVVSGRVGLKNSLKHFINTYGKNNTTLVVVNFDSSGMKKQIEPFWSRNKMIFCPGTMQMSAGGAR